MLKRRAVAEYVSQTIRSNSVQILRYISDNENFIVTKFWLSSVVFFYTGFARQARQIAVPCGKLHCFAAVCTLRAIKANFFYGMLVSSGKMYSSCRKCIGKQ